MASHQEKMPGLRLLGNERAEMAEFPKPVAKNDWVVVKVKTMALCGSDIHYRYRPSWERSQELLAEVGMPGYDPETIPGHEVAGEVVEIDKAKRVKVGDRVFVFPIMGNTKSVFHRLKLWKYCRPTKAIGYAYDGGNAEYLTVPERNCYRLPARISWDQAAMLLDPVGAPYGAIKPLCVSSLDTVAIYGVGPIGLGANLTCNFLGARTIAIDLVQERLDLAKQCGAHYTINPNKEDLYESLMDITDGLGPDVFLECAGHKKAFQTAMELTKPQGRIGVIGEPGNVDGVSVSDLLIHKDLQIIGSWVYDPEKLNDLLELIEQGLQPEKIITHTFVLKDSVEAWKLFNQGRTGKIVIHP